MRALQPLMLQAAIEGKPSPADYFWPSDERARLPHPYLRGPDGTAGWTLSPGIPLSVQTEDAPTKRTPLSPSPFLASSSGDPFYLPGPPSWEPQQCL